MAAVGLGISERSKKILSNSRQGKKTQAITKDWSVQVSSVDEIGSRGDDERQVRSKGHAETNRTGRKMGFDSVDVDARWPPAGPRLLRVDASHGVDCGWPLLSGYRSKIALNACPLQGAKLRGECRSASESARSARDLAPMRAKTDGLVYLWAANGDSSSAPVRFMGGRPWPIAAQ